MGYSIHMLSMVLVCLLAALVVLVVGQLAIMREWPTSAKPTEEIGGIPRRWVVFAAPVVALFAAYILAIPLAIAQAPSSVETPWMFTWGLVPCVILGYLSGRWWAFAGAAPMLGLMTVGLAAGSTSEDTLTNADLFLALPMTAAVAVALSLGSIVRCWRSRGERVRHHRAVPA
jgi:hypothetical protein